MWWPMLFYQKSHSLRLGFLLFMWLRQLLQVMFARLNTTQCFTLKVKFFYNSLFVFLNIIFEFFH